MHLIELTEPEVNDIHRLVHQVVETHYCVEDSDFLGMATVYAHQLPTRLRQQLNRFRLEETDGVCLIRGYTVDDAKIGPTPDHWRNRELMRTVDEDVYFFLCCCLVGDPIGWASQQDGRVLHDIQPIRANEGEQLGSGSREELTWHTEDAFHPMRTDYLGLIGLRNPDRVETTWACVGDIELSDDVVEMLFTERFTIRPDHSHLPGNIGGTARLAANERKLLEKCYAWIMALDRQPEAIAVLFGDPDRPYLRIDPYFMDRSILGERARAALEKIVEALSKTIRGYAIAPGEVMILDNYRAVHGRRPFAAKYDGTDRWLKRLNIARDLRKSRARRPSASSRVLY